MDRNTVTPGQQVVLRFRIKLFQSIKSKIEIEITFNPLLKLSNIKRTLKIGRVYTTITRHADVLFSIRNNILGKRKSINVSHIGEYKITHQGSEIHREKIAPIKIMNNQDYFEQETVPNIFNNLGYNTILIGGKDEPDIVAYHKLIKTQFIDVEPTLCDEFKLTDFDSDMGKFKRYKEKYDFKRMITVCEADSISRNVIDQYENEKDPVTLIEYADLWHIYKNFKKKRDYHEVIAKLNVTGKIWEPNSGSQPILFKPKVMRISRTL